MLELSEVWGAADFSLVPDVAWVGHAASAAGTGLDSISQSPVPLDYCALGMRRARQELFPHPGSHFPHLEVAADVRLHNRRELFRALGTGTGIQEQSDDCEFLIAAYDKWGEDCGRFLLGEFAFAIWDRRRRCLFCCRDHVGSRPFFYWKKDSRFLFATDRRSILAAPGVSRELNHRKFAGLAIIGGYDLYHEETFHSGIFSLPSASSLTIDRNGMRQRVYWEPKIQPDLVPRRPEDAFEALRGLLVEAVECRMADHSSVAVYLSGGLDSAAVTSIAARRMGRRGRTLLALSASVPDDQLGHFPDEREFANEYSSDSNVRLEYVTAPGAGPFDSIHDPGRFVVSARWNRTLYLHEALEKSAVSSGANVVLQGLLGELGPTCPANTYYAELALKGRWPTLIRELRLLQAVEGIRPLRFLAGRLLDLWPVFPRRRTFPLVLMAPNYRRSGGILQPFQCPWPDQRLNQAALIRSCMRGHAVRGAGGRTPRGHLRISQPWLDKRVLEFCLSAPPHLKVRNGYRRNLIREALDGVLPKKIQWRTSKTAFSPDYNARYNAQLGKARDFVAEIGPKDPIRSIIDVDNLGQMLDPIDPQNSDLNAPGIVPATIYAICFLRQFADFRP